MAAAVRDLGMARLVLLGRCGRREPDSGERSMIFVPGRGAGVGGRPQEPAVKWLECVRVFGGGGENPRGR